MAGKITKEEFYLAFVFAIGGLAFSSRAWLGWLNTLSPLQGLGVYYGMLFAFTLLLSQIGFKVGNINIHDWKQALGILFILFSFFIIVNFESPYVQYVTEGEITDASSIFYQSEDGATFYVWHEMVGVEDMQTVRFLTFVLTPFVLTLLGGYLVVNPKFSLLPG